MPRTLLFCDGLRVAGLKPLTFNLNMREVNSRLQCKNMFANYSTFYPANPEPRTPNPEPLTPNPEPRTPNPKTQISWSDHLFFILLTFLYPLHSVYYLNFV